MPRCLHLHRVENPIRIFQIAVPPIRRFHVAPKIPLHVDRAAPLQLSSARSIAGPIHDGIHIHVTRKMRHKLIAVSRQNIHDTARQIAGRHDLTKGERGKRTLGRSEDDGGISRQNHRRDEGDEREKRSFIGTNHDHHTRRLRHREIKMRGGHGINRAKNSAEFVRPAGIMDEPVDCPRNFVARLSRQAPAARELGPQFGFTHLEQFGRAI